MGERLGVDCQQWPETAAEPTDYWLATLPDTPLPKLVRLAKICWRIEHDYRELTSSSRPYA